MKKKTTVFIIDNDKQDVGTLKETFAELDAHIKCFSYTNSITALRRLLAVSIKPTLIIINLQMPLVSGKNWLLLLKNEPSLFHIPVLVASHQRDLLLTDESIKKYAFDRFTKPLFADTIRQPLQKALAQITSAIE